MDKMTSGVISATAGQTASWTLQTFVKGSFTFGPARTIAFGAVQSGQANSFLIGNWANNYFNGGGPALVNGPGLTGNNWSRPKLGAMVRYLPMATQS